MSVIYVAYLHIDPLNRNETRDLMSAMENHYLQSVTLEELASISGRSLSSFRREFESTFQTTPAKWIQEKRLQKAKEYKCQSAYLCININIINMECYLLYSKLGHFYTFIAIFVAITYQGCLVAEIIPLNLIWITPP